MAKTRKVTLSLDERNALLMQVKASMFEELVEVLELALYDLDVLNKKDPGYRPRCSTKSRELKKKIATAKSVIKKLMGELQ